MNEDSVVPPVNIGAHRMHNERQGEAPLRRGHSRYHGSCQAQPEMGV